MKHNPSDVTIYVTTDYKIFNRIRGNRQINKAKVRKIVHDIRHGHNLLGDFPILVTANSSGKLDVIDGQHRLESAVQTKNQVFYIIRKQDLALDRMARFNSIQEKWKPADFINCYIEKGVKDYGKLQDFMELYGLPVSIAINLLYFGVTGGDTGAKQDVAELFRKGEFKCKHLRQATDIIESCKRFEQFSGWNTRPFIVAISKVLSANTCDFDELVEKFVEDPKQLNKSGNTKSYLTNLEQIYNKGYHKRRTIF